MTTFFTGIGIGYTVISILKNLAGSVNFGIYAKTAIPFITSIPSYLASFIQAIGNFLPPYVVAPFLAMFGILVCYVMCHLFAQFIDNLPG